MWTNSTIFCNQTPFLISWKKHHKLQKQEKGNNHKDTTKPKASQLFHREDKWGAAATLQCSSHVHEDRYSVSARSSTHYTLIAKRRQPLTRVMQTNLKCVRSSERNQTPLTWRSGKAGAQVERGVHPNGGTGCRALHTDKTKQNWWWEEHTTRPLHLSV